MSALPVVHVSQHRGLWVATVESGAADIGLTTDPLVPVIIEDEQSKIDWQSRTYRSRSADSGLNDWWNLPQHQRWRELILEGRPILLRRGIDWETRTAGPKVALFEIADLSMSLDEMSFRIVARVAECRK